MELTEIVAEDLVKTDVKATSQEDVVHELVRFMAARGVIPPDRVAGVAGKILERESLGSTAMGNGLAFPHAELASAGRCTAVLARSRGGVDFNSLDGEPVHLLLLIVYPPGDRQVRVRAVELISRLRKKEKTWHYFLTAENAGELLQALM